MGQRRIGQASLAAALLPARIGANRRPERIAGLIDWAPLERLPAPLRAPTGRPGYPPLAMLRALLLAQQYQLSDPGLEEALADRLSFRRFCGFGLDEGTPDETTICHAHGEPQDRLRCQPRRPPPGLRHASITRKGTFPRSLQRPVAGRSRCLRCTS